MGGPWTAARGGSRAATPASHRRHAPRTLPEESAGETEVRDALQAKAEYLSGVMDRQVGPAAAAAAASQALVSTDG